MAEPAHAVQYAIATPGDRYVAATNVGRLARAGGFSALRAAEAALVASELCSNMLVHAAGGHLILLARPGSLSLLALDFGPPIENLQNALRDNTGAGGALRPEELHGRHGIGCGLGAIRRVADRVVFAQSPQGKLFWVFLAQARSQPAGLDCDVSVHREAELL